MIVTALLLAALQASDPGATVLFHQCQAEIRVLDSSPKNLDLADFVPAGECLGYLDGFTDGVNLFGRRMCNGDASMTTLARVYVAFLSSHPKVMEYSKSGALAIAINETYPCPKQ